MTIETLTSLYKAVFFIVLVAIVIVECCILHKNYKTKKQRKKWTVIYNEFLAGNITATQYARICAIVLNNALNRQ